MSKPRRSIRSITASLQDIRDSGSHYFSLYDNNRLNLSIRGKGCVLVGPETYDADEVHVMALFSEDQVLKIYVQLESLVKAIRQRKGEH
jgi:hypothetical protein